MEENKIEAKEREFGDESIYTVLFTAGTALLMACLKRFIMMFFIEQWRLWVFLLLNVVLLAIFFTSMPSSKTTTTTTTKTSTQDQESEEKINITKKPQGGCGPESEEIDDHVNVEKCEKKLESKRSEENDHQKQSIEEGVNENENEDDDDEEEETSRLSKEELNERVEAFIATFRKHLVSDAIRGRSDHHCFYKKKRENFSSQGGKCFVL
ncbi:hypothetical protein EZV62_016880 [Acer yangbiense]|uniref:DUF4408 domain-containing protein n=1 Tax=Acer yangbiense TaxID=1000413 RepID=A0A5C7HPW6_9ROSI|nr:hypothetical protein EZV62_016880 [Acer yangbiense]